VHLGGSDEAVSRLTALAARHGIQTYDADGYDLDEYDLRAACLAYLVKRTNELFAEVERMADARHLNLYAGTCRANETALRYALVDLDSLNPTLDEIADVGEQLEAEGKAA
jgi:hypothetical protein